MDEPGRRRSTLWRNGLSATVGLASYVGVGEGEGCGDGADDGLGRTDGLGSGLGRSDGVAVGDADGEPLGLGLGDWQAEFSVPGRKISLPPHPCTRPEGCVYHERMPLGSPLTK